MPRERMPTKMSICGARALKKKNYTVGEDEEGHINMGSSKEDHQYHLLSHRVRRGENYKVSFFFECALMVSL